jgi:hypothetical protein
VAGSEEYVDHVEIGRHNITEASEQSSESIAVTEVIYNHCYNDHTTSNDVALLILASDSSFTPVEYVGKTGSVFEHSDLPVVRFAIFACPCVSS